jgi:hypothetical protein
MTSVYNAFKTTKKRVLLLDLNGTIVFKEAAGKYLKRDTIGSSGMLVEEQVSYKKIINSLIWNNNR